MNRIYWDSMLFVYLIEANPQFAPRVQKLLERMESRGDRLLTSVFTLGEVLAGPRKSGAQDVVARIQNWFDQGPIEMLPFDRNTANQYSLVRAGSRASQATPQVCHPRNSIHRRPRRQPILKPFRMALLESEMLS